MLYLVGFYRPEARKDDSTGGPFWEWKDFLCQSPEEAL